MATTRDYYEVLSVDKSADGEEIKRAYRRLAMKYHPDRNPGDTEAEAKFKEAAEAYEALSNPEKRRAYDQYGHAGLRGTPGHDFRSMDPNDIFSMFNDIFGGAFGASMGGGGGRRRQGVTRGFDLETMVEISLKDVLNGVTTEVDFTRMDVCETCQGSGAKPGTNRSTCRTCGGHGQVAQTGFGGMFRMVATCPSCKGKGTTIDEPCTECRGSGRLPRRRRLDIKIPPGIRNGQEMIVRGEGEPPAAEYSESGQGIRGDLHVVVRIRRHPIFERENDDLHLFMPISFTQAALGAEINIPTLEGETKVTIPRGSQHGRVVKVSHQGIPHPRSGRRGDLNVHLKIEIPNRLNKRQETLLREFAETEDHSVLPETQSFWKSIKDFLGGKES